MALNDFPRHGTRLLAVMIELIGYGCYLSIFVITFMRISRAYPERKIQVVPGVMVFLFVITTVCVVLQMVDLARAFITYDGGPLKFYNDYPTGSILMAGADLLSTLSLISTDAFLIWRLYIIWDRDCRICIVPGLLLLGTAVCGLMSIIIEFKLGHWTMNPWAYASTIMSTVLNILVTALISGKLWRVGRATRAGNAQNFATYQSIIAVLVQSGALYLFVALTWILCHILNARPLSTILSHLVVPITALVPTYIVLHLSYALKSDARWDSSRLATTTTTTRNDATATYSIPRFNHQGRPSNSAFNCTAHSHDLEMMEVDDTLKGPSVPETTLEGVKPVGDRSGMTGQRDNGVLPGV